VAVSAQEIIFATDLFAALSPISTRKMMGGLCIYSNGQLFATIGPENRIYIKAKAALADALKATGSIQFSYANKDGSQAYMSYWTLPVAALDDPEQACEWARQSLAMFK